jgi:hypothetical protein
MKMTAEFLEHALQFEQLAGEATDAEDRARMLEQAQAYRKLADERQTSSRIANIEVTTFGSPVNVAVSLRLEPKFLDDRPPFLGVGLHQRAERFRRLLFARENFHAEIGVPGSHRWIGQGRHKYLA